MVRGRTDQNINMTFIFDLHTNSARAYLQIGFGMARMMWMGGGPGEIAPFFLIVTVFVLSFMLILVISPLYHDVSKGLFKMMSTQSLMASSYVCGISVYSLAVYFVYTFVTLTLFYG